MRRILFFTAVFGTLCVIGCTQPKSKKERAVGGSCEDCGLMFVEMPQNLSWGTQIAKPGEAGEPMTISGTIYSGDGKTPAPDIILYVYHTNNEGYYAPADNQTQAKKHGRLRGWMKTDSKGRYTFSTIRPASYPNRKAPQHVHPIIKEPTTSMYWIDEFLFDDDPLLTSEERARQEKRGGSGIVHLRKNEKGVWIGERDIILGENIPGY